MWNPSITYMVRCTVYHNDGSTNSFTLAHYGKDPIEACLNAKKNLIRQSIYDKFLFEIVEQKTIG